MRICVLSSGSGGNCLWVEAGSTRVLVDAGLSIKITAQRCESAGLDLRDVTDLLITHEHADHCTSAGALARKRGLRVHATPGTLRALRDKPPEELCFPLVKGEPLLLGALRIEALPLPHDAAEPVGFVFEERSAGTPERPTPARARAAIVTDLGSAPAQLAASLGDLDALVLEMNHDTRMLLEGPYPFRLKQRIHSDTGHLSNDQGAKLLASVLHAGLRHVALAHLSEHNNTEAHARRAAEAVLERAAHGVQLVLASQQGALDPIVLQPHPLPAIFGAARQLSLFGS